MGNEWRFEQDDASRWRWTRKGDSQHVESARSFESPVACVLDAVRYVVERRRSDSNEECPASDALQGSCSAQPFFGDPGRDPEHD
jgi:hypothetical protein